MSCGNCTNCSNKCNVCENCDTRCNTQQTFGTSASCRNQDSQNQFASKYIGAANAPTINRDDIIIKKLPRTTFNELIQYINRAAHYPTSGGKASNPSLNITNETRNFIYADKVNEILNGLKSINSTNLQLDNGYNIFETLQKNNVTNGTTVKKDAVIYAKDFNNLMNRINWIKLSTSGCVTCNSGCNANCDTCDSCNSCISCNTCQSVSSYSSHYSSHYSSCDTPPPSSS